MSDEITPHFAVAEFRCHDGTRYPSEFIDSRLHPLCAMLEVLRSELGDRPITILSGYRSPAHNVAVGGGAPQPARRGAGR